IAAPARNGTAAASLHGQKAARSDDRSLPPANAAPSTDLGGLAAILLRRWPSILALTVLCLGLAASYLLTTAPTYQATT
ncbi:Wzz/FepE/Etk N-terminal domain-containing protein, partial [Acinetobacter baumannii]